MDMQCNEHINIKIAKITFPNCLKFGLLPHFRAFQQAPQVIVVKMSKTNTNLCQHEIQRWNERGKEKRKERKKRTTQEESNLF